MNEYVNYLRVLLGYIRHESFKLSIHLNVTLFLLVICRLQMNLGSFEFLLRIHRR